MVSICSCALTLDVAIDDTSLQRRLRTTLERRSAKHDCRLIFKAILSGASCFTAQRQFSPIRIGSIEKVIGDANDKNYSAKVTSKVCELLGYTYLGKGICIVRMYLPRNR